MVTIDGAYGEGGGQIVRTALSLAAIFNRAVRIENIRAGRKPPGLKAQHLAGVRAAAMICDAAVEGDQLGSTGLIFRPQSRPAAGLYEFDVSEAREGGSAGAATLVLQTILLPLALAARSSVVTVRGGTHVQWSPSFHYLKEIYLPALARLGIEAGADLLEWGWYPAGEGAIRLETVGQADFGRDLAAGLWGQARGKLEWVTGLAVASSLPAHIAQRMADRAASLLRQAGLPAAIEPRRVRSVSPGAGIFLAAGYEGGRAGFSALGKKGKPSEQVAEEAVNDLLAFHQSGAALDQHLADQLILPLALAGQPATLRPERITNHTRTNIWAVEHFLGPVAVIDQNDNAIIFRSQEEHSEQPRP